MSTELSQTPLAESHHALGARMVEFAGWSMPIQYKSIMDEHHATRKSVGLFDVSHMGRFHFTGKDSAKFLDSLTSRRVAGIDVGSIRYSLMCKEDGGILDDVLVYHLQKESKDPFYAMVVNASNRPKIASWIEQHLDDSLDVKFEDKTLETSMIAVQGPKAIEIVQPMLDIDLGAMKYYTGQFGTVLDVSALVSRTGYTGEDGCEIITSKEDALKVWNALVTESAKVGGIPAGLGARDTLRLEAAMPLYGHELNEDINPIQVGLKFAVNLKDRQFVGRDSLLKFKSDTEQNVLVGLELEGRRAAREHCKVFSGQEEVGEVTSGSFSPTLEKPVAMAFVKPAIAAAGGSLDVDIRGKTHSATIVKLPFYKRPS